MKLNLIFYWGGLKVKIIETGLISSYYGKPLGRYEFELENNCDVNINLCLICRANGIQLLSDLIDENIKIFDEKLNEDIGKFVGPICLNPVVSHPCRILKTTIVAEKCDFTLSRGRAFDLISEVSIILRQVYHKNIQPKKET